MTYRGPHINLPVRHSMGVAMTYTPGRVCLLLAIAHVSAGRVVAGIPGCAGWVIQELVLLHRDLQWTQIPPSPLERYSSSANSSSVISRIGDRRKRPSGGMEDVYMHLQREKTTHQQWFYVPLQRPRCYHPVGSLHSTATTLDSPTFVNKRLRKQQNPTYPLHALTTPPSFAPSATCTPKCSNFRFKSFSAAIQLDDASSCKVSSEPSCTPCRIPYRQATP